MEVVEFADRGDAGVAHLGKGPGGDASRRLGVERADQVVHGLAPAPEAPGTRWKRLTMTAQTALEGMRMRIDEAGEEREARKPGGTVPAQIADVLDATPIINRDLHTGREPRAGPGELRLEHLAHGRTQHRSTSRSSTSPARRNSATGRNSLGRCAASMLPGPNRTQRKPARCSQPASVANITL